MSRSEQVKFLVKWNGGRFALLCSRCNKVIKEDFNPDDLENKTYYCSDYEKRCYDA